MTSLTLGHKARLRGLQDTRIQFLPRREGGARRAMVRAVA
jgi:hypothetical protein